MVRGLRLITYAPRGSGGGGGSSLELYIYFYFVLQAKTKEGKGVQITCKNAHIINGRPLIKIIYVNLVEWFS